MAIAISLLSGKAFILLLIMSYVNKGCSNVLISEINADNPGYPDVAEYVELWNTDHCQVSLDSYRVASYLMVAGSPTQYKDVSLSNLCIPGNGYFLLGPGSLSVDVDLEINDKNFIPNGDGIADVMALFKTFASTSPLTMSTSNLEDGVVYDNSQLSNTSGVMPNYFPTEPHVWENDNFSNEDESISRCTDVAKQMSAFMASTLTPSVPNLCQQDSLRRWPSPCRGGKFPDTRRKRSFLFTMNADYKGQGVPFLSLRVKSLIDCSRECSDQDMCTHLSYSHTTAQPNNCLLHDSCSVYQTASADWLIAVKFYKQSPRNPVWPHDVPI